MSWLEIAALILVGLGLFAGAFLVSQRPGFWIGLGAVMLKAALPYFTKRMDPETEKRWRDCERRGGKWNHFRKRCE